MSGRRSSADGRDTYYRVDLARCGRPAGCRRARRCIRVCASGSLPPARRSLVRPDAAVLFLCTGNSARSQIAEALLDELLGWHGRGAQRRQPPEGAPPQRGSGHGGPWHRHLAADRPSTCAASPGTRFDHVITLCDRVREVCPEFPGSPVSSTGASPTRRSTATPTTPPTRLRAHRRRARDPHRLPARHSSPPPHTDEETSHVR